MLPTWSGGRGTAWGAAIGAAMLIPVSELLHGHFGATLPGIAGVVFGMAIILVVLLLPNGIYWAFAELYQRRFVKHRDNLVRLNPRLHPVLARVIADMTRLRRTERAADLSALIDLIDDYRSVEVDDAEAKAGELADVTDLYAAGADYVTVTRISDAQELYTVIEAADAGLLDDKRAEIDAQLAERKEVLP